MPISPDSSFVPLGSGGLIPERADPAGAEPRGEGPASFRPLGQAGGPVTFPGSSHEPRVNVQRDGDRVTSIQIQCTCGQIIELACAYEPAPPASPPVSPAPVLPLPPPPAPAPVLAAEPASAFPDEPEPVAEPPAAPASPPGKPAPKRSTRQKVVSRKSRLKRR